MQNSLREAQQVSRRYKSLVSSGSFTPYLGSQGPLPLVPVHKGPPFDPTVSYLTPVQVPLLYECLLVIRFNIIVPCTPISPKSSYFPTEIMDAILNVLVLYSKLVLLFHLLCMQRYKLLTKHLRIFSILLLFLLFCIPKQCSENKSILDYRTAGESIFGNVVYRMNLTVNGDGLTVW